jgi:hypothetical protein
MNSNNPNLVVGAAASLWKRAPLWRVCAITAAILSVATVCFPPHWRWTDVKPLPPLPESIAYAPPQNAFVAHAVPAPAVAPEVKPALAAASSASPAAQKQAVKVASNQVSKTAVVPLPKTNAPINAQISLAVPNASTTKDPSGLDSALLGRTYHGSIEAGGFNVPLPPGRWAMLANSSVRLHGATGMAYFLGRIEHKKLVGAVRLFAVRSIDLPGEGFPAANSCTAGNPDLDYLSLESVTPYDHHACWLINNFFTPPMLQWADRAVKITNLDRAAAGDMAAKGVSYPQDLLAVRFTRSEKWGLLEVMYLFDPELDGISSSTVLSARESDWHAPNVGRFPDKVAYVAKTRAWGEGFWPSFQQAFDSGKPPSVSSAP